MTNICKLIDENKLYLKAEESVVYDSGLWLMVSLAEIRDLHGNWRVFKFFLLLYLKKKEIPSIDTLCVHPKLWIKNTNDMVPYNYRETLKWAVLDES